MSKQQDSKQPPASGALRRQYGALVYRQKPKLEVLLITSRETKRWVIPKGWPMRGKKPHEAAAQETAEEAGMIGKAAKRAIGTYVYWKALRDHTFTAVEVSVYPFKAKTQAESWPEQHERTLQWFSPKEAAVAVFEPGLKEIITGFARAKKVRRKKAAAQRKPAASAAG